MISRVLFPTDLKPLQEIAMVHVAWVAKLAGAEVTLFHAVKARRRFGNWLKQEDENKGLVKGNLENCALKIANLTGGPVDVVTGGGKPELAILEAANKAKPDLILFGTPGREGLKQALLGSPVNHVVQNAPCPCLVLRKAKPETGFNHILVLLDPEEAQQAHLEIALEIGRWNNAELTLLALYNPDRFDEAQALGFLGKVLQRRDVSQATKINTRQMPWSRQPVKDVNMVLEISGADMVAVMEPYWNEELARSSGLDSLAIELVESSPVPVLCAKVQES